MQYIVSRWDMEDSIHKKNKVLVKYTVRPYDLFYDLTYYSLKQAKEQKKLRTYNCMITMVFCAFSIEAFINHLGAEMIPGWESFERKPINDKLKLISNSIHFPLDKRKKPICYIDMIFNYRDNIAHGRTETINKNQIVGPDGIPEMPSAEWEEKTTLKKAEDFRKYTKEIIISLSHDLANNDFPLGLSSDADWWGI